MLASSCEPVKILVGAAWSVEPGPEKLVFWAACLLSVPFNNSEGETGFVVIVETVFVRI